MKKTYAELKAAARNEAIEWQISFSDRIVDYYEFMEEAAHFEKLAKRYGLIKEFRWNGII